MAAAGLLLRHRAASEVNRVALSDFPKDVGVIRAQKAAYRPVHRYVGTLRPWIEAKVGPQFIGAYVSTVLVRPGAVVKRNQVLEPWTAATPRRAATPSTSRPARCRTSRWPSPPRPSA